ncbi:3-oxoadipate enol-lactonase [Gordonia desulfuricans]|uniref:3-oxoadipate enol-lactonase n=1 Tax=Gordonia desulfuricans TaxID=89051 RepID=A0A7K3LRE5_9ACTN|nr:3-oxoadipate enol-lactonase [Gordonia desulfuricans]NDK90834.1 3-oxoadipate enol-lactonase [Gordonia desulfuricans]
MSAVEVAAHISGREDGPVVVLSNSLGSDHRMWDEQIAELDKHFRVVRYDTRGHGASPVPAGPYSIDDLADDVIALLDRLGVAKAHIVGLSLGGMTAMRLAVRNPERVDRVVLFCTSPHMPPADAWKDRAGSVRSDGTASIAESVVSRWFSPGYLADPANRTAVEHYQSMVAATPDEGYAGCCEAIAGMDQRAEIGAITAPTLAVAGADDPATPPATLASIVESIAGARLLVVDDAAHLAPAEQPATITPAIIEHLEQS